MADADLNDPVKRGLYLAALGHCVVCHSRQTPAGMDYVNGLGAGGRKFGPQQAVIAANLTTKGSPPGATPIKRALVDGVSKTAASSTRRWWILPSTTRP